MVQLILRLPCVVPRETAHVGRRIQGALHLSLPDLLKAGELLEHIARVPWRRRWLEQGMLRLLLRLESRFINSICHRMLLLAHLAFQVPVDPLRLDLHEPLVRFHLHHVRAQHAGHHVTAQALDAQGIHLSSEGLHPGIFDHVLLLVLWVLPQIRQAGRPRQSRVQGGRLVLREPVLKAWSGIFEATGAQGPRKAFLRGAAQGVLRQPLLLLPVHEDLLIRLLSAEGAPSRPGSAGLLQVVACLAILFPELRAGGVQPDGQSALVAVEEVPYEVAHGGLRGRLQASFPVQRIGRPLQPLKPQLGPAPVALQQARLFHAPPIPARWGLAIIGKVRVALDLCTQLLPLVSPVHALFPPKSGRRGDVALNLIVRRIAWLDRAIPPLPVGRILQI
mmetsp:Transcript_58935/g.140395  ORF Transcript_58935/g.140395 Transcript_58935/m.140395 type:complete len:391 (+) Transcript_58935:500-1672(+)